MKTQIKRKIPKRVKVKVRSCVCCENCHCESGDKATDNVETVEKDISYDSLQRIAREYYLPTPVDENSGTTFIIEENSLYIETVKINKEKGAIAVFRYYENGSVREIFDPVIIAKAVQTLYVLFWEHKKACDIKVTDDFDRVKNDFYQNLYSGAYSVLEIREDVKKSVDVIIKDNGIDVCTVTFNRDGSYRIGELPCTKK